MTLVGNLAKMSGAVGRFDVLLDGVSVVVETDGDDLAGPGHRCQDGQRLERRAGLPDLVCLPLDRDRQRLEHLRPTRQQVPHRLRTAVHERDGGGGSLPDDDADALLAIVRNADQSHAGSMAGGLRSPG